MAGGMWAAVGDAVDASAENWKCACFGGNTINCKIHMRF